MLLRSFKGAGHDLYFYRARYYDSSTSRFLSEDPIRFTGGMDFYSYVRNRPVLLLDSDGKDPGLLTTLYGRALAIVDWGGCSISASYCLTGLADTVKGIHDSFDGNFNGPPADTYNTLLNTQRATGGSTVSNIQVQQACAANQNCMQTFEKCLSAIPLTPFPTPPLAQLSPKPVPSTKR